MKKDSSDPSSSRECKCNYSECKPLLELIVENHSLLWSMPKCAISHKLCNHPRSVSFLLYCCDTAMCIVSNYQFSGLKMHSWKINDNYQVYFWHGFKVSLLEPLYLFNRMTPFTPFPFIILKSRPHFPEQICAHWKVWRRHDRSKEAELKKLSRAIQKTIWKKFGIVPNHLFCILGYSKHIIFLLKI